MAVYEITAPDGSVYDVTAPDNATESEILAYAQSEFNKQQPFSATEMVKNIPSSGMEYGKNIASAIMHPINTVSGILDVGAGELQKVLPQPIVNAINKLDWSPEAATKAQESAGIINEFYKQRYGSGEKALKTIEKDPVGFLGDLSALVTGVSSAIPGASAVTKAGAAIEPLNVATNIATYGLSKAIPKTVPASMYESAAKWSTTLSPKERASLTQTALQEQIMPTYAGVGKAQSIVSNLGNKIDDLIQSAPNEKIPANEVLKNIQNVRNELGGFKIESPSDIKELNAIEKQFRTMVKGQKKQFVTVDELQKFKQDVYKRVDYGRAPEKPSIAKEEAYKAMGKAAKETIEQRIPEIGAINQRQGKLLELTPNLIRAAGRIENRDIAGIGAPIKITAGQATAGDLGAIAGAGQSIFDIPKVKAGAALNLYKKQNQGLGMFYDNNAVNALVRQLLQQQGGLQQQGLLNNQ